MHVGRNGRAAGAGTRARAAVAGRGRPPAHETAPLITRDKRKSGKSRLILPFYLDLLYDHGLAAHNSRPDRGSTPWHEDGADSAGRVATGTTSGPRAALPHRNPAAGAACGGRSSEH
ncbi:hypothetical protein GCM10027570_43990 [Streptomonospora sediminis]